MNTYYVLEDFSSFPVSKKIVRKAPKYHLLDVFAKYNEITFLKENIPIIWYVQNIACNIFYKKRVIKSKKWTHFPALSSYATKSRGIHWVLLNFLKLQIWIN